VVEPSQGAHFFHNVTSFRIGYLTIPPSDRLADDELLVDDAWLRGQRVVHETSEVVHVELESPVRVVLDGRKGRGTVVKPKA
jgi:hypothetical protein